MAKSQGSIFDQAITEVKPVVQGVADEIKALSPQGAVDQYKQQISRSLGVPGMGKK